jgi:2-hydroxychromene-2-carboxylate isomerase
MTASFYYDVGSPYAYLAAERVDELMPVDVEWHPVLLGGLFQATGRSSWALTEHREAGIAEIERRAAERGLPPMAWPEPWPGDGLLAMRAAVVAHRLGRGREFALQALRVHFREGRSLNDRDALEDALARAGLDPASVLEAAADQPTKTELRDLTAQALERGVTGVPSIIVAGEVFWGDDRLQDAARAARHR